MQFESHATPPRESPPQRYATLHRAIERGLAGDDVWGELTEVCLELGRDEEAARCAREVTNDARRLVLESRLARRAAAAVPVTTSAGATVAAPPDGPAAAPAASIAGPLATPLPAEGERRDPLAFGGLGDHLADALQFLLWQRMPWLVLPTTLAFPLVVGLGGVLTAGRAPLLVALAAVPGLCVLAVTAAMARRILVASAAGHDDVPRLGDLGALLGDALRSLCDALLVAALLLAPPLVAFRLGSPISAILPALVIGAFFAPLALALRQVRGDLGSVSPVTLVRGVARAGSGYLGIAAACLLAFAPAAAIANAVSTRPVWVQIAVIGPLVVLPLFVVSRLLGTWLDGMRLELGAVLLGRRQAPAAATGRSVAPTPTPTPEAADASRTPRFPRRPEALAHFAAPVVRTDVTRRSAEKRPPTPGAPAAPAAPPAPRRIEGKEPQRPALQDAPDLTSMPGALVVSGSERVRQGAAARRQD